ncbi:hypothetical protein GCM10018954_040140 [Kutzneria kofuensis]
MSGQHRTFAGEQQCGRGPGTQLGHQFPTHHYMPVETYQLALLNCGAYRVAADGGDKVASPVGTVESVR